jgi:hypothetical protein
MSTVAEAMGGPESHRPWNNQAAFLRSERGKEYMRQFTSLIDAQKKNVRKTPAKAQRSVVLQTPLRTCTVSYQDAD